MRNNKVSALILLGPPAGAWFLGARPAHPPCLPVSLSVGGRMQRQLPPPHLERVIEGCRYTTARSAPSSTTIFSLSSEQLHESIAQGSGDIASYFMIGL